MGMGLYRGSLDLEVAAFASSPAGVRSAQIRNSLRAMSVPSGHPVVVFERRADCEARSALRAFRVSRPCPVCQAG